MLHDRYGDRGIRGNAFSLFSRPFEAELVCKMVRHGLQVHQWSDDIELLSALPEFFSLRIRCSLDTADRLVQFCKEMPVELPEEERDEVGDAFREMLLNAIEHGGKFNPADWVRVSRVRTNRTLVYHIQDPGKGFLREEMAHSALTNPTDDPIAHMQHRTEQGLRPGGFGMLIVRRLVDEVIYNERGNEVILIKHLD